MRCSIRINTCGLEENPKADAHEVGLSATRVDRIGPWLGSEIGAEKISGAIRIEYPHAAGCDLPHLFHDQADRHNLIRHASGLTYGFFCKDPAKQAYLDTAFNVTDAN